MPQYSVLSLCRGLLRNLTAYEHHFNEQVSAGCLTSCSALHCGGAARNQDCPHCSPHLYSASLPHF